MADPVTPDGSCCACLTVVYRPREHGDGSKSERWVCASCGREFVPRAVADENLDRVAEHVLAKETPPVPTPNPNYTALLDEIRAAGWEPKIPEPRRADDGYHVVGTIKFSGQRVLELDCVGPDAFGAVEQARRFFRQVLRGHR